MKKMESMKIRENKNPVQSPKSDDTVEVLYQKMGDRWFAFSLIDEEVFMGSIPQSEIDASVASDKLGK